MKKTRNISLAILFCLSMASPASAGFIDDAREYLDCIDSFARQLRDIVSVERITNRGRELNGPSSTPSISDDGRSVAFESRARNVLPPNTNNRGGNIFLWKWNDNRVTLVSHAPNGNAGNDFSQRPQISADGKFIVFHSLASNLVEGDNNNTWDVFLYNVDQNKIQRVSILNGMEGNGDSRKGSVSGNGKIIAFQSMANNWREENNGRFNIYVTDLSSGAFSLISRGLGNERANNYSRSPHLSTDGEWVTFVSAASNLVEGDRNRVWDIFVSPTDEKEIRRVSVASDGTEANGKSSNPRISRDGLSVIFESDASNLVEGDTNGIRDLFHHDLLTGQTIRFSIGPDNAEANGESGSPDFSVLWGDVSAFHSEATNLATDFRGMLRDYVPGWVRETLEFLGEMPNIPRVPEDRNGVKDVYFQSSPLMSPWTLRGSINRGGQEANGASTDASMAHQVPLVVFSSDASNLVPDDRNQNPDIFVAAFQLPHWDCAEAMGERGGGNGGAGRNGRAEEGGVEEPFSSCHETDGGSDPYLRGMVIAEDEEGNIQTATDHCCGESKTYLEETNCVNGRKQTDWYRCVGCRNGACIRVGGELGADRLGRVPRVCR